VRTTLAPDRRQAEERYRRLAPRYDRSTALGARYRRRAVDLLALRPGARVLDVACGTGVNFELIESAVGPRGAIIGVDLSAEMLAQARRRVERERWRNVTLLQGAVEEVELPSGFDAALFSLTHDVLQSGAAVERVVAALRPGGRAAAFGGKWAPSALLPVNAAVWLVSRRYVTTFSGFDRPWRELERLLPDLFVRPVALGAAYLAWGSKPAGADRPPGPR
jgi:SAM-dependent methyltransferase